MHSSVVIGFLPVLSLCSALCVQGPEDVGVLDCILKDYDAQKRPQPLTVINMSLLTESFTTPDETSLDYTFRIELTQSYIDQRLQYQPANGSRSSVINAWHHMDQIWRPRINVVENQNLQDFDASQEHMYVAPNGVVTFYRKMKVKIKCHTILEIFPFDKPVCPLTFIVADFTRREIDLKWVDDSQPVIDRRTVYLNAYLDRSTLTSCPNEIVDTYNMDCLRAVVIFARERSYYWVTIYIPGFIMVTSSFMTFWLSIRACPPRAMIGTTTRITFLSTAASYRSKLTATQNLVALNIWDSVSIVFIYVSLCEFILADFLDRHPRKGEEADAQYLERALRHNDLSTADRIALYFRNTNKRLANDLEIACRVVFPVLYFGFIIGYFIAFQEHYHKHPDYTFNAFQHLIS